MREFQEVESGLRLLAEAEQKPHSCALVVAKTIEHAGDRAEVLADIARSYAEAGQRPSEKDTAKLRDIVHTTNPMRQFWE